MTDANAEARDKMRRTIMGEFIQMEDDFDTTRAMRSKIVSKLMSDVESIKLLDADNKPTDETDTGIRLYSTALKALSDMEKSNSQAIMLKLKQSEQEIASSAAAKDRIAIVLRATAPGRIETDFPSESLEQHLAEMFDGEIQDFELKTNPRDLDSS